jgi:hypothetical protein
MIELLEVHQTWWIFVVQSEHLDRKPTFAHVIDDEEGGWFPVLAGKYVHTQGMKVVRRVEVFQYQRLCRIAVNVGLNDP